MLGSVPGWPAVLADGPVTLRPYRRGEHLFCSGDCKAHSEPSLDERSPTQSPISNLGNHRLQ